MLCDTGNEEKLVILTLKEPTINLKPAAVSSTVGPTFHMLQY